MLIIALIPYYVKADMGAPTIKPYDMVVTSPDGKDCIIENNTIHMNKDDVFTVKYEYNNNYTIEYNNKTCTLKSLEGSVLVSDELDPKTTVENSDDTTITYIRKLSQKEKAIVYSNDGADVKKGPANIYDTVAHLDKGKIFEYTYYIIGGGITHVYIEDGNIKGWVEILNTKVLIEGTTKYIAKTDVKLSCATIPQNTIITPKYTADAWSRKVLVEYEGCTELVSNVYSDIVGIYERKMHSKKELVVYEYFNNEGKELTRIPNDTDFTEMANATTQGDEESKLYISYEGINGWVKLKYDEYEFVEDIEKEEITQEVQEEEIITIGEEKEKNVTDYAVKYVIIGFCIMITAVIIIILINRKKNKSEE